MRAARQPVTGHCRKKGVQTQNLRLDGPQQKMWRLDRPSRVGLMGTQERELSSATMAGADFLGCCVGRVKVQCAWKSSSVPEVELVRRHDNREGRVGSAEEDCMLRMRGRPRARCAL